MFDWVLNNPLILSDRSTLILEQNEPAVTRIFLYDDASVNIEINNITLNSSTITS